MHGGYVSHLDSFSRSDYFLKRYVDNLSVSQEISPGIIANVYSNDSLDFDMSTIRLFLAVHYISVLSQSDKDLCGL